LLITLEPTAGAADKTNSGAGLAVYSDMNFIELEGEFSGLQIVLVQYIDGDKRRQKVLWRSAAPFLNAPLLLDAVENGNVLKVVVPQGNDHAGAWTLTLRDKVIDAVGPNDMKYSLKRISARQW
jgi:hypothetical protein